MIPADYGESSVFFLKLELAIVLTDMDSPRIQEVEFFLCGIPRIPWAHRPRLGVDSTSVFSNGFVGLLMAHPSFRFMSGRPGRSALTPSPRETGF